MSWLEEHRQPQVMIGQFILCLLLHQILRLGLLFFASGWKNPIYPAVVFVQGEPFVTNEKASLSGLEIVNYYEFEKPRLGASFSRIIVPNSHTQ
jgi:hypothetical protein